MNNFLTPAGQARRLSGGLLVLTLSAFGAGGVQAQALNYVPANAQNVAGTYTDLGTTGTVIATANTDDANSAPQTIPFTFNYNGTAFTQFVLNTNGVIRLGATAPSTAQLYYDNDPASTGDVDPLVSTNPADVNLIMPLNTNLEAAAGAVASYSYATTGTAPARVCTIQWTNVSDKDDTGASAANVKQYANISFQAKLYETGVIEFVYGPTTPGTGAAGIKFANVGLKGSGLATGQVALALKPSPTTLWSTSTFIGINYTTQSHDISKTAPPDLGRTYRFGPGANTACLAVTDLLATTNAAGTATSIRFIETGAATSYNRHLCGHRGRYSNPDSGPYGLPHQPHWPHALLQLHRDGGGQLRGRGHRTRIPAHVPYHTLLWGHGSGPARRLRDWQRGH